MRESIIKIEHESASNHLKIAEEFIDQTYRRVSIMNDSKKNWLKSDTNLLLVIMQSWHMRAMAWLLFNTVQVDFCQKRKVANGMN